MMLDIDKKYDLDMCSVQLNHGEIFSEAESHISTYEFICEDIVFSLTLYPEGKQICGELSSQITYLPDTLEDAEKRLFYLTLLKTLGLNLDAPFVVQNQRYVLFKKSFKIKGKADIANVMYHVYNIILTYLPYIKIFK